MMRLNNPQGATSLAEYAITVLLVIGVITAMTTYVKRGLQARMRDARHYMINEVNTVCNSQEGCQTATSDMVEQYEPYYTNTSTIINQDKRSQKGLLASSVGSSGNFVSFMNSDNNSSSRGVQAPPMDAR